MLSTPVGDGAGCVGEDLGELMTDTLAFRVTGGLLALTLAIGGAGLTFPSLQVVLGLASLAAAAFYVARPAPTPVGLARPALLLLGALFALPLLQLIPLPPLIWTQLPGRENAAELDRLLGWTLWRPWSLDVEGTIRSLLVLIPSAVIFVGCVRLRMEDRVRLLWIVLGFALFGALLGIAQFASGGRLTPFVSAHVGYPVGLFVNRNHQAVFLLAAGIPLAAALGALRLAQGKARAATMLTALSAIAMFAITVIATTSRMAFLLLPLVLGVALTLLFLRQSIGRLVLPSMLALAAVTLLIAFNGGFGQTLARFSSFHDARFDYFADVQWALGHYGLAGTGIGTFVPVHKSAESLASITPSILNHAHNDFVELLLEGGMAAALLLLAFFGLVGVAVWRTVKASEGRRSRALSLAGATGIAVILLFSLVDYPLRMPAIGATFALQLALLLPSAPAAAPVASARSAAKPGERIRRGVAFIALGCAAALMLQAGISSLLLNRDKPDLAAKWAPWSTEAKDRLATRALLVDRDPRAASGFARSALHLSPLDAPAIRTMGLLADRAGATERSFGLMRMAVGLGWRDPITNLWAIDTARRSNEADVAVQRAEALYRQHQYLPAATAALLQPPIASRATAMIVRDLSSNPDWRRGFLQSANQLPAEVIPAFVRLVMQLNRTSAPATLEEARPLMQRLSTSASATLQQPLWQSLHARALVANGGFGRTTTFRGPELPSDWDMSDEDISALSIDRPGVGGTGNALRLYGPRRDVPLIAQHMMLKPGTYTLAFQMRAEAGSPRIARWRLRCLETGADVASTIPVQGDSRWRSQQTEFAVPKEYCATQRLAFELSAPKGAGAVWIDNVILTTRR